MEFFEAKTYLHFLCGSVLAFTFSLSCSAQEFNLMPWPARIEQQEGFFKLARLPRFEVKGGDERVQQAIAHLKRQLRAETTSPFSKKPNTNPAHLFFIRSTALC